MRIEGATPTSIRLLRDLPAIDLEAPAHGDFVDFRTAPTVAFRSPVAAPGYLVTFEFLLGSDRETARWSVAAADHPRDAAGRVSCVLDGAVMGRPEFPDWHAIARLVAPLVESRLSWLPVEAWVEALDAAGQNVVARSKHLIFGLHREEK